MKKRTPAVSKKTSGNKKKNAPQSAENPGRFSDVRILLRVKREDIVYLNGLIEAYDGLAVFRTLNPYESIVELLTTPDCLEELKGVLNEIRKEVSLEILNG